MEPLEVQRLRFVHVADAGHHGLIEQEFGGGRRVGSVGPFDNGIPVDIIVNEVGSEMFQCCVDFGVGPDLHGRCGETHTDPFGRLQDDASLAGGGTPPFARPVSVP
jgi:hypothetical protein